MDALCNGEVLVVTRHPVMSEIQDGGQNGSKNDVVQLLGRIKNKIEAF